jgi:hypothetical protein
MADNYIMSCLQYSIQSTLPSLLGLPADADVLSCSNYGSTGGTYPGPNGLRSQFSDTIVPTATANGDQWLNNLIHVMNGSNSVVLRPVSAEDQAAQHLGVSFLPWNQRPYERTTWGTNSQDGTVFPFNPWNQQTMISNGITVAKVAGIGLAVYYSGKLALKMSNRK